MDDSSILVARYVPLVKVVLDLEPIVMLDPVVPHRSHIVLGRTLGEFRLLNVLVVAGEGYLAQSLIDKPLAHIDLERRGRTAVGRTEVIFSKDRDRERYSNDRKSQAYLGKAEYRHNRISDSGLENRSEATSPRFK